MHVQLSCPFFRWECWDTHSHIARNWQWYSVLLSSFIVREWQPTHNDSWQLTLGLGHKRWGWQTIGRSGDWGRLESTTTTQLSSQSSVAKFFQKSRNPDFYVKYPNVSMLATNSKIFKNTMRASTAWAKPNISAGLIQPTRLPIHKLQSG